MTATALTSRKVLVPLATLLAAGALAVGSGATWTSTTDSSVAVTSGTLIHTNDHDGATLTLADIKPGDTMTGTVTVENTGDVDSTLDIAASGVTSTFSDDLTITVLEGTTELYDGSFADLAITQTDIDFDVDATVTYTFTVALDAGAANVDQDKAAGATFTWTQTQVDGESLVETWVPGV
jgi:hypothetical protein